MEVKMVDDCRRCEHYESVTDGYGLCVKDAIPVMVVADYGPTKNFKYCEKKLKLSSYYGEMPYQKEDK